MMLSNNQDISTHRYFGDNDDEENSSSSQSPPSTNQQQDNNYFFSYGRSSSLISQQNNHKHHSNHHSNSHHTYKVLVSGGGFAGLVFSYYLLHSLSHKHNNLPIEITIVEKASVYRQVGAIITLEGEQVIRALKEMNLEEELHQIEIPRSKQHFYTKNGRHVRSFDESSVIKYKEEGRRYERHKFHEILMKRIKPLIVRRDGNLTILSNANLHSNSSTPSSDDELSDDKHFKMNRVIYSMRPSLFNKEKIEVTLMNKNDWLHLQYQKEQQENIQMKRSSSVCSVNSPLNTRILNDISNLERKDSPTNRLSKLHKRKSTGSSGDLQQMEEEAMKKSSTTTPAEIATPNSAGKESAGWRRFFQKKESNAQSPSQKTKSDSSSNILLEGSPMSAPLNTINDPKRTSMNDLLVTFNEGDSFESSVYQSTEDRKLYQIEREEYDLVVGSDGIHSQTRALIFGDESNFKHFLGVGYFCFIVDMILTEADEQQVSEKYWNNVYGSEKKSTESFDPTQISGIKGLEPLTPDRIAKMKEVSKKLAELIKDGESSSVLLNHGRYMNVLRYGNKLSVSLVYRQPKEEDMLKESSSYTVSKSKSFVDDALIDSPNDSKSPSTHEKWRKRFSLFRKHTESPIKNDLAQDPSSSASSLTNHFYSFDINKFEDHHDNDDQRSVTHSSDSSEDHEEVMEEEDEEIAEAFMEMVNESMANRESASVQNLEEKCVTPNSNNSSSSPTSNDEKSPNEKSEKKQKKKKVEKSHHSKTFFISAEDRKNFLKNKFDDCGFLFHDIMDLVFDSRIIYYDDLAQIRNLDNWYKGKCVLVGDACQACTPLSGKGGALAIVAAKTLALELRNVLETHASTEGEDNLHTIPLEKSIYFDSCLQQAFEKYENAMQERIKTVQKKTVWEGVDVYLAKSGVKRMVRDGALKFLPKSVLLKLTKKEEEQGSTIIVKKDDYYHSEDEDSGDDEREEEEDIYSSIHVKFFTCANEPVVLHQNVKLTRGVGHYYLARELNDSSLEKLVEISQKRIFDSSFDNLLFTIRGNFQMEVFFRIMLGIAGVKKIDRYLDCILSSYEYAKNPPPPPLPPPPPPPPPVNQQPGKKKKKNNNQNQQQQLRAPVSYFGNEKFREERDGVDYRWCPLTHQIDSLIDLMKFGDDSQHTENMAKYVMDLTYRSVASFSVSSEIATKFCLPHIANQFISGKCYDNDGEQTYIVTLRKSNGGTFKLVHFRPEKDSDSTNPYEFFKIHILDPAENIFEKECFGSDDCLVQNAVQKHISGLEELSFESLCNSVMCIVFLRGYLINIRKDENPCESVMNQSVWENIEIPTRRRKTLSASIEPAQIGDVEDLDPLTIFWVDEEPTTHHQYGDVAETRNPKIKDQVYGFVLDLIAEYRSIQRDSIFSQKYRALQDSMRFYSDGIGDVYDFEYKEKNLYYVKGKYDFHYCAIVCGFEDIVICGKAAGEIFYWTPFCYFRSGKKEDKEKCTDDEEKRTDHDVSHLEPLKELKEVTFDKVLDNIEEFFSQFM
ncbi:predicted protein [Naegleria gruberi]|uniref:Predicted protein n=1 Tax=Naegleria gruberi TaxID=5762 RepID=D2V8J1_NAEGR|nr:uncharacterized protein NAEGRDRAFT_57465 [Naegleria gruberi]EFC46817.1 predicted protein [Naegleria gruberi]|eukprot:XP_002679561.1 predicted protein [Naegleria gruberi strain NEG-M]